MKKLCLLTAILFAGYSYGQERIIQLVEAENNFARHAREHNTRDAFLQYMDSNALVFEKGQALHAKQVWLAKARDNGKLLWQPSFAVVSNAGDLGVTTGPWEFKKTINDTALATGVFTSVWVKKPGGEWKWVIDMGVEHGLKPPPFSEVRSIELTHVERSGYDAGRYLLMAEQQFIAGFSSGGKEHYAAVADNDIHFINPGQLPVAGKANINEALVNMSGAIRFEAIGSGVSKDGDLGYVYGYVTENGKKGNYLRVWRRVGRKWTILLQTLTI